MKEMIYDGREKREILYEGRYRNFHFVIVSYGSHPCAYVKIPKGHPCYGMDYDDIDVDVHGGLTFGDDLDHVLAHRGLNTFWIGWDYAHCGDCYQTRYIPDDTGRKWTTKEIYEDVKSVIRQLGEKYESNLG